MLNITWNGKEFSKILLNLLDLFCLYQAEVLIQGAKMSNDWAKWVMVGRAEIGDILSRVTLKFDGWPWKTIGHLFYTT